VDDHTDFFNKSVEYCNVVPLDDKNGNMLPPGMSFFRVKESVASMENVLVDMYVLVYQVYNPSGLKNITAQLTGDKSGLILSVPDPDEFVHEERHQIASSLAVRLGDDQLKEGYVSTITSASSKAAGHLVIEGSNTNLAVKKLHCIFPPGEKGNNDYFNEGESTLLSASYSKLINAHHLFLRSEQ